MNIHNSATAVALLTKITITANFSFYYAPTGVQSIVISVSVCLIIGLSVGPFAYLKNHVSEFHQVV